MREVNLHVPLVVRMKGTNEHLGKQLLETSGLPIIAADDMADAARKIVAAVRETVDGATHASHGLAAEDNPGPPMSGRSPAHGEAA